MDIAFTAQTLTAYLAPAVSYLLGSRNEGQNEVAQKLGLSAWKAINRVWTSLRPRLQSRPAALEAAEDLAKHPGDDDAQAVFRLQLRKILVQDSELAREVIQALQEVRRSEGQREGTPADPVAMGGDIRGPVIAPSHG